MTIPTYEAALREAYPSRAAAEREAHPTVAEREAHPTVAAMLAERYGYTPKPKPRP